MIIMPRVNDEFLTLEALEEAAQAAAKVQGFAFSRRNSNLEGHNRKSPYIVLQCTKGEKWRNNWNTTLESRKRNSKTRRCCCPVRIRATAIKKYSYSVWIVTKTEYVHNHQLLTSDEVLSLPQHRSLNINQKKLLYELHTVGTPTRIITTAINQFSDGGVVVPKDVVNQRARIRYALNEGPNADSAQKLLRLLQQRDYMIELLKTPEGHLTHLFFSHIEAAKHAAQCPEVLIIDATYKTNVYKFPLVSAVGISNITNEKGSLKTFQIAMAWIENEKEYSYRWFLKTLRSKIYDTYNCIPCVFMSDRDRAIRNASEEIFPEVDKMLCTWHLLEQNLKTNCRKLFDSDDDYIAFKSEVQALQSAFNEEHIEVAIKSIKDAAKKAYDPKKPVAYVETLLEDSKLWINAFTKNYCHMGISTTARAESSHSAFKRAIETASGLETVFEKIDQRMRIQHLKAAIQVGVNKVACDPFTLRDPRFSIIIGSVSTYAIDKIKRMLAAAEEKSVICESTKTCQCLIRINYKLPCYHIVPKEGVIPLNIIDKRWHLNRPDIKCLPRPALDSPANNPELYKLFLRAEEIFHQLPDDTSMRAEFLARINQVILMPLSKPVKAPNVAISKGRPSKTKREKLMSERQNLDAKKKQKLLHSSQSKLNKSDTLRIPLSPIVNCQNNNFYKNSTPKFMEKYILSYTNVRGDGNCGFRAIAISLGKPEDEWPSIRHDIFNELANRRDHYVQLFLEGENEYNNVVSIVQWEKGPCGIDNWMLMPSFGYPIANTFQRPIHYFSRHQCLTFLPDNIPLNRNQPIAFAFIDTQNHYIAIKLKPNAPVPTIVQGWQNICLDKSKIWAKLFEGRIAHFQKALKNENITKDQIISDAPINLS